jgi:streptomycin 6-kinase
MNDNYTLTLPESFLSNTLEICGENGERWLNELPQIIEELSKLWDIKVEKPFQNLSYNFVAPCLRADGSQSVLKIALPLNNPEIFSEALFLRSAKGKGAANLLEFDEAHQAILIERLIPGASLKQVCRKDDAGAAEIAIGVMRQLLKESPTETATFQSLEDWFSGFDRAKETNFPGEFVNKASTYYHELSSDSARKFLIHGDLHHDNILSAERAPFLAIDPKGIIGDIGYEISVFLNNHVLWLAGESEISEKLKDIIKLFSEAFEIEPIDLRKWAFAQMVLSAWWTFEENGTNLERELALAEFWKV